MSEKSEDVTTAKQSHVNDVKFRDSGPAAAAALDCEAAVTERHRVPRRVIHCNDGVIEEYSTDEEEDEVDAKPPVNPKTLPWPKWCWHYVKFGAVKSLAAADYCGEKLAWFFGITSPKYQYVLDEYNKQLAQAEEERKRGEREQDVELARKSVELSDMQQSTVTVASHTEPDVNVDDTPSSLANSTQDN